MIKSIEGSKTWKRLLLGACITLMLGMTAGCSDPNADDETNGVINEINESDEIMYISESEIVGENTLADVSMQANLIANNDEEKAGENLIQYVIKNDTSEEIDFGEDFMIEALNGDTWYTIKHDDIIINDMMNLFKPGERSFSIYHEPYFGILKKGHYRLIKTIYVGGDTYYLTAEFDVGTYSD